MITKQERNRLAVRMREEIFTMGKYELFFQHKHDHYSDICCAYMRYGEILKYLIDKS